MTLEYTAFVVVFSLLVGLGTALLMNAAFHGRGVMRAVLTTPVGVPGRAHDDRVPVDAQPDLRRRQRLRALAAMGA